VLPILLDSHHSRGVVILLFVLEKGVYIRTAGIGNIGSTVKP
jgi:hypothetical protein